MWERLNKLIKDNWVVVLFGSQPFTSNLIMSNPKMFKYDWIWEKTTATWFLNAKKQPLRNKEDILVFYKKQPTYNPQKTTGHKRKVSTAEHKRNSKKTENYWEHNLKSYNSTERYPKQVLKFATDKQKSSLHPTQKPVALIEYLIKTYSHEWETILDFTMWSWSTGVACMNTNREFIWIELDKDYFDIAKDRILTN